MSLLAAYAAPRLLAGLRFLEKSIRRVAPVIHDLFLVRRLTANARAAAGSQMARELHDGAIQSLFNLNLQIEEMRRQNGTFSAASADFLSRIQQSIQKEITALRDFMQQLRSLEINAESLLSYLAGLSVKFECENGITTRFIPEVEEVEMSPFMNALRVRSATRTILLTMSRPCSLR